MNTQSLLNGARRAFSVSALSLLVGVAATTGANAQAQLGVSFATGFPTGEFRDTMDNPGFGVDAHIGYQIPETPVMVGLSGGAIVYGSQTRQEQFSETIPDVVVDVQTSNNIAFGNVFVRLQPQTGDVRPYAGGFVGFNYLYTSTSVQNRGWEDRPEVASSTNYDDIALSYGGEGGVLFKVYEPSEDERATAVTRGEGVLGEILVDVGVRYASGEKASYLTTGSVHRNGRTVTYTPTSSRTDMILGKVGVVFRF